MPSDRSRRTDDLRDGYKEVVAQQGRVILDRDFNALQGLTSERIEVDALDIIGPCGTPDDGFKISVPATSPPSPPLWSPPATLEPPRPRDFDFLISPGTMYVGGQRAVFPGTQAGHAIGYSYYDQPDWIDPPDPFRGQPLALESNIRRPIHELVYLDLVEQEVSAVEDPELLDVALGGPDTTQRIKLMRRVKREAVSRTDCAGAWKEAEARWLEHGLSFDPRTMRLEPVARLQVGFTHDIASTDPCDPVATGGYLGADNQLIRVQISDPGTTGADGRDARLLWGYDNASFLYRVTSISSDRKMLTLAKDPPDAFHIPQSGQLVEILRTAAVLGKEPDETEPGGQPSILRVVADSTGELRRLARPYGPVTTGDPTSYIVFNNALPQEYADDLAAQIPLFLRVWQAELPFNPGGARIPLDDPASGASTGVEVTISLPKGGVLTKGAYWLLAMRPATPQAVYPERLLTAPQPPDGPRQWACSLAVIDWTMQPPAVQDCRKCFDNLVELSRRRPSGSCCTVHVRPEQLNAQTTLQSVIDAAADLPTEAQVTVCLAPGYYTLNKPLRLDDRHTGMVIEGCGGAANLVGSGGDFPDGLMVLIGASDVTLRGLTLTPQPFGKIDAGLALLEPRFGGLISLVMADWKEALDRLLRLLLDLLKETGLLLMVGVRAVDSTNLTLERCSLLLTLMPHERNHFAFGLFATGNCSGLRVLDCQFGTGFEPTSSGGMVPAESLLNSPVGVIDPQTPVLQGAVGCLVSPYVKGFSSSTQGGGGTVTGGVASSAQGGGEVTEGFTIPALLNDASFCRNSFRGMTLAIAIMAEIGTLRILANTVSDSVGGFWIRASEQRQFSFDPGNKVITWDGDSAWLRFALTNSECLLLLMLGLVYPPPEYKTDGEEPSPTGGSASIFIAENEVVALPADQKRAPQGGPGLAIFSGPAENRPDQGIALVVSANRFLGRPPGPCATVLIDYWGRCTFTGNLISVDASSINTKFPPQSLFIVPGSQTAYATHLAVTGNVLDGNSNLGQLRRADAPPSPFDTWLFFNSTA